MTPEQTDRLIDALESIAFDLKSISGNLDPHARSSAASFLIDAIQRIDAQIPHP